MAALASAPPAVDEEPFDLLSGMALPLSSFTMVGVLRTVNRKPNFESCGIPSLPREILREKKVARD